MNEKKQTSEEFAQWLKPCIHGKKHWVDLGKKLLPRNRCIECITHYGDLRAQEEREKTLAELRSMKAEIILTNLCQHGKYVDSPTARYFISGAQCEDCRNEALAIAQQEGKDEAKAELLAEWRATDVVEWFEDYCLCLDGQVTSEQCERRHPHRRWNCKAGRSEALARARAQGPKQQGHAASCSIHQSRTCDCVNVVGLPR